MASHKFFWSPQEPVLPAAESHMTREALPELQHGKAACAVTAGQNCTRLTLQRIHLVIIPGSLERSKACRILAKRVLSHIIVWFQYHIKNYHNLNLGTRTQWLKSISFLAFLIMLMLASPMRGICCLKLSKSKQSRHWLMSWTTLRQEKFQREKKKKQAKKKLLERIFLQVFYILPPILYSNKSFN